MIVSEIFYGVTCNRCDELFEEHDVSYWSDEGLVIENATESEWLEIGNKHYCPNCQRVNDETDEVEILEDYPKQLKVLRKFIKNILKRYSEVYELDKEFLIKFHLNNQPKLEIFEVNYIKDLLGGKFISLDYENNKLNRIICSIKLSKQ
jgi:hypothetical protein